MVESVVVENLLPRRDKTKEHTPAFKIFHYNFMCRIAQMHLHSAESLEQSGMLTTGNAAWDRAAATAMVPVQLTIAGMAEYVDEGATISFENPADTAKVYRIIKEHLDLMMQRVQQNVHQVHVPEEDLRKLDAVAAHVYPYARYHMQDAPYHGKLLDVLTNLSRGRGMARPTAPASVQQAGPEQPVPQSYLPKAHTPMADSIIGAATQRRKSWDSKTQR